MECCPAVFRWVRERGPADLELSMPAIVIRQLTLEYLALADSVRDLAGWNQTSQDWRRLLACEPKGCFLAQWNGISVGTATALRYGHDLAWIGMLLVHPDYRRRGIAAALLEHCLEYLSSGGIRCVKLDATPAGESVYARHGFQVETTLTRWEGETQPSGECYHYNARSLSGINIGSEDWAVITRLDRQSMGAAREPLLKSLVQESVRGYVMADNSAAVDGFGLLKAGSQALYLGPVTSLSSATGIALARLLLQQSEASRVYWDIPDGNGEVVELAIELGFSRQRPLTRMWYGASHIHGNLKMQFGIGDPSTG